MKFHPQFWSKNFVCDMPDSTFNITTYSLGDFSTLIIIPQVQGKITIGRKYQQYQRKQKENNAYN